MPEETDLTKEQDAALERAWARVGAKLKRVPPSRFDDGEPGVREAEDQPDDPPPQ